MSRRWWTRWGIGAGVVSALDVLAVLAGCRSSAASTAPSAALETRSCCRTPSARDSSSSGVCRRSFTAYNRKPAANSAAVKQHFAVDDLTCLW